MVGGCTDPRGTWNGRFEDNGTYVGPAKPSIKFISSAPGSGNNMTYVNRLGVDPKGKPTVSPNGKTVTDYAELSPAPSPELARLINRRLRGRPESVR